MRPRYALATHSLNLPIRSALKVARAIPHVSAVRIDARHELKPGEMSQTGKRQLFHFLRELDLEISAFSFSVRRAFSDLDNLDQRVSATKAAMDLAALMKVRHLCVRVGTIPQDITTPAGQLLTETVSDLARHGNRIGVTLTLIPAGEPIDAIAQFIDQIKSGPLAIDFDPSRMLLGSEDPVKRLRALHRHVEQFTARDATRDFDGGVEETALGRGEIVWDELLATLGEIDYRGFLTLSRTQGDNRQADIEQSLGYLQRVVGEF